MEELRERLEELERLEKITNKAENEMTADCTNAEKEAAFDVAWENEYDAIVAVAELIVKLTSEQIDIKIAMEMVRTKRQELLSLVA